VPSFHQVRAYFKHWLTKVDRHSVHSPYFFDFYNKVIKSRGKLAYAQQIEEIRNKLAHNATKIQMEDLGSGRDRKKVRKLKEIVNTSVSPSAYAQMLLRICQYANAHKIVELGTSVGLTSLYLSYMEGSTVYTFEGSHALVNIALTNFEYLERPNIEIAEGDIDHTLPDFIERDTAKIGFVYIDANHTYDSTVRYYGMLMKRFNEKSIMVIDDIHNTTEMERAWNELRQHKLVYGSVDLFRCGILFFEPTLNRQHFVWSL